MQTIAVVPDIDHLNAVITHATAPAFMLGAVAAFLSILISRMERVVDRNRALRALGDADGDPELKRFIADAFVRRMTLLSRSIYFAVLSALVTAGLLIVAFVTALLDMSHAGAVAVLFIVALSLMIAALVELAREIRVHTTTMHID